MAEKSKYQDIDAVDAALDKGVAASTAIGDSSSGLTKKVTDLEQQVDGKDGELKYTSKNSDYTDGLYVRVEGTLQTGSGVYCKSNIVNLKKGEKIAVSTISAANIAVISLTDESESNYTCLVEYGESTWSSGVVKDFEYVAEEDCYVVVCGNFYSAKPHVVYKTYTEKVEGAIQDIKDIKIDLAKCANKVKLSPVMSLVDDDCDYTNIPTIKSICDNADIKATFACIHTRMQSNEELVSLLKTYQEKGFGIIDHPQNSTNWGETDVTFDAVKAEKFLVESLQYFQSQGFVDYDHFVAPGGYINKSIIDIVSRWCKSGIGTNSGISNHIAQDGKYNLHRIFVPEHGTTLASYTSKIDAAYSAGDWLILGCHSYKILDDYNGVNTKQLLADVIAYAKTKGFVFKTYQQAYKERAIVFDAPQLFE